MEDKNKKKKKGFTLIELLIVVLIIGVVASMALPMYFRAMEKTRAVKSINLLGTIAKAEQRHKLQNQEYSDQIDNLDITLRNFSGDNDASGSTFDNQYFDFILGTEQAQAARKNNDYTLYVDYTTSKITCSAANEDDKICELLGLEAEQETSYQTSEEDDGWEDCSAEGWVDPDDENSFGFCYRKGDKEVACVGYGDYTPYCEFVDVLPSGYIGRCSMEVEDINSIDKNDERLCPEYMGLEKNFPNGNYIQCNEENIDQENGDCTNPEFIIGYGNLPPGTITASCENFDMESGVCTKYYNYVNRNIECHYWEDIYGENRLQCVRWELNSDNKRVYKVQGNVNGVNTIITCPAAGSAYNSKPITTEILPNGQRRYSCGGVTFDGGVTYGSTLPSCYANEQGDGCAE